MISFGVKEMYDISHVLVDCSTNLVQQVIREKTLISFPSIPCKLLLMKQPRLKPNMLDDERLSTSQHSIPSGFA